MNLLSIKKLIFVGCSPKFLLKQAHSNPKLIDLVVKSVSDIDELDDNQKTLLCYACIDGHFDVAKALIDANANVNAQNNESSPLQFASARGSLDIVELLISSNADVNYQDKNGFTVLHWASTQGKTSILDSLLKAGADLNKKDKTEKSIIHTASDKGFPEMVLAILEKGVDPNSVDKEKNTPLHFAALSGHDKVVRILLEQTSNKNPHNNEQRTPIHFASRGDQPAVIETLLKMSEVEVDTVDSKGNTPLHVAATEGSLEAAKILLSHGADINKKTYSNWGFGQRTPLYLAQYYSHDHLLGPSRNENQRCRCASVAVLLKDSGADLSYEYESWGKWTTKCVKNTAKFAVKLPVGMIAVGLGMG